MNEAVCVWRGVDQVPNDLGRTVVTIGVFDGVHLGHQQMLRQARAVADRVLQPLVVVTFDPHPAEVVRPGTQPPMLATLDRRVELLHEAGADAVLVLHFSPALSRLSPAEFVQHVLVDALHAQAVVVGGNFHFGHRATGTVETLKQLGKEQGFEASSLELSGDHEVPWSSTYIRQCVAEGDVAEAARVLGRPHRVEGAVVHGDHRGRGLGYPTANLDLVGHLALPADGVYAGHLLLVDRTALPAAISVGTNPTFDGTERRIEAYVLDRDDLDLYGQQVAVDIEHRLRDTLRFDSAAALADQMAEDVRRARALLAGPAEK